MLYSDSQFKTSLHWIFGEEKWMEFVGVAVVNGFEVIYCSKNSMTAETRQDWVKEVIQYHPTYWFTNECRESQSLLSLNIEALMKSFNHTKGTFYFYFMDLASLQ